MTKKERIEELERQVAWLQAEVALLRANQPVYPSTWQQEPLPHVSPWRWTNPFPVTCGPNTSVCCC